MAPTRKCDALRCEHARQATLKREPRRATKVLTACRQRLRRTSCGTRCARRAAASGARHGAASLRIGPLPTWHCKRASRHAEPAPICYAPPPPQHRQTQGANAADPWQWVVALGLLPAQFVACASRQRLHTAPARDTSHLLTPGHARDHDRRLSVRVVVLESAQRMKPCKPRLGHGSRALCEQENLIEI